MEHNSKTIVLTGWNKPPTVSQDSAFFDIEDDLQGKVTSVQKNSDGDVISLEAQIGPEKKEKKYSKEDVLAKVRDGPECILRGFGKAALQVKLPLNSDLETALSKQFDAIGVSGSSQKFMINGELRDKKDKVATLNLTSKSVIFAIEGLGKPSCFRRFECEEEKLSSWWSNSAYSPDGI